jgi:DNA-directed RNA polymerase specialized sigma24 family protein|tara:strand:- start:7379 stop:8074 length:696 start_codon:yes stop_codon:yes gene_type:complete
MSISFEQLEPIIDLILEKNRSRWKLGAVKHFDFDDLKQEVKVHVYNKLHMWNRKRPFEPWVSQVIHNQIQNKKRNLWRNHEKPCSGCYFNKGMGNCSFTNSGDQCSECPEFSHWEKKKKNAYELKTAISVENEGGEIPYGSPIEIDHEEFLKRLDFILKSDLQKDHLDLVTYNIFRLTWIEKLSDKEIAKKMGYKTNEENRGAGYRSLASHRKIVHNRAKEILEKEDYNFI